ncbi:MAG: hypothetical protein STSR0008_08490 [Ignavibacterium sp.]
MNKNKINHKFIPITFYGIAMGFLEAIVVVYLRELYYPNGFDFPLSNMPAKILGIEWIREITTIIMLIVIGIIAGKNPLQKFAYFIFTFGVWDILYYVALKIFLDWPTSILTWDILFLIPITWLGPVLAPIICSITMILLSIFILYFNEKGYLIKINFKEWFLIILGAIIIFITFIWDFSNIIIKNGFLSKLNSLPSNTDFQRIVSEFIPQYFNWYLFGIGELLILLSIALMYIRINRLNKKNKLLSSLF